MKNKILYITLIGTLALSSCAAAPPEVETTTQASAVNYDFLYTHKLDVEMLLRETEEETQEETKPVITQTTVWANSTFPLYIDDRDDAAEINVIEKGYVLNALNYDPEAEWTEVLCGTSYGFVRTAGLSTEEVARKEYIYYYINDGDGPEYLSKELQEYVQDILYDWEMSDFYFLFICQAYHESRFKMSCVGKAHGGYNDWGIMQIWEGHEHDKWSPLYSTLLANPDYKTDAKQNLYCGLVQWRQWVDRGHDYITALGCYNSGTDTPSQRYIDDTLALQNRVHIMEW